MDQSRAIYIAGRTLGLSGHTWKSNLCLGTQSRIRSIFLANQRLPRPIMTQPRKITWIFLTNQRPGRWQACVTFEFLGRAAFISGGVSDQHSAGSANQSPRTADLANVMSAAFSCGSIAARLHAHTYAGSTVRPRCSLQLILAIVIVCLLDGVELTVYTVPQAAFLLRQSIIGERVCGCKAGPGHKSG